MTPSKILRQEKLYGAIMQMGIAFVSNSFDCDKDARYFLKEEIKTNGIGKGLGFLINEITSPDQAPPNWTPGSLLWGTEDELTVETFLAQQVKTNDPEYQRYLELKEKFGNP